MVDGEIILYLAIALGFFAGWIARQETMGIKNKFNRKSNKFGNKQQAYFED